MMNSENENLENGKREIWRRQILVISNLFLFIPVLFTLSYFFEKFTDKFATPLAFLVFLIYQIFVAKWYSNTPCPNCGKPILSGEGSIQYRYCTHCKIDLRPKNTSYEISFKPIKYQIKN